MMRLEETHEAPIGEEEEAVTKLADARDAPSVGVIGEAVRGRSSRMAPLFWSTLLVAAAIMVFRWSDWLLCWRAGAGCQPGTEAYYVGCYSVFGRFLLGQGLYFGASVAGGVEGLRGRRYGRWLWGALGLLLVPFAARAIALWLVSGH